MSTLINALLGILSGLLSLFNGRKADANKPEMVQAKKAQAEQDAADHDADLAARAMKGDKKALEELQRE